MEWIRKLVSFLRNNVGNLCILAVCIILALFLFGCQGLANANGDNNQIVISREVDDVLH